MMQRWLHAVHGSLNHLHNSLHAPQPQNLLRLVCCDVSNAGGCNDRCRLQWRWSLRDAAIGVSAGAGALAVNSAMLALTGQVGSQAEATGEVAAILQQRDVLPALLLYCGSALLAPAAEELAYRGFLLPSLQRVLPTPVAVFAVALLFAAAHLQPDGLVQLTVVGVLLGAAAAATGGNLAAPTLGHMVYNSALFLDLLGAGAHGSGGATGAM